MELYNIIGIYVGIECLYEANKTKIKFIKTKEKFIMKRTNLIMLLFLLSIAFLLFQCGKKDNNPTAPPTPEFDFSESFENGLDNWYLNYDGEYSVISSNAHSGNYSIKLMGTSIRDGGIQSLQSFLRPSVNLEPSISFWYQGHYLCVKFYSTDSNELIKSIYLPEVPPVYENWQYYEIKGNEIPEERFTIYFIVSLAEPPKNSYLDDILFEFNDTTTK